MENKRGPMGWARIFIMALCWLWIAVAVLFMGLRWALADKDWFLEFYREYGTLERIGISAEDCALAMSALIDYMEGERDSIQLTVTEFGAQVEMYNQQEIVHMVDVKNLYQGFRTLLLLLPIPIFAIGFLRYKGRRGDGGWSLLLALLIGGGAAAGLGVWVMRDFTSFWVKFHHLFFTNDLWLMDYNTCRMIRICPEEIFYNIVLRMAGLAGLVFLWGILGLGFTAGIYRYYTGRRKGN